MNDAFGKRISKGDIVVYSTRQSSALYMHVGEVTAATDDNIRVRVLASTSYGAPDRSVSLRAGGNVIVANGIDAMNMDAKKQ